MADFDSTVVSPRQYSLIDCLDQLSMRTAIMDAQCNAISGEGFEGFRRWAPEMQSNFLWGIALGVEELRAVARQTELVRRAIVQQEAVQVAALRDELTAMCAVMAGAAQELSQVRRKCEESAQTPSETHATTWQIVGELVGAAAARLEGAVVGGRALVVASQ